MTNTQAPVRTPVKSPQEAPLRRLHPDELCPAQKERVVRTIRRDL